MDNDFENVHFESSRGPPLDIPKTLFTPSLPCVVSLKALVVPEYGGNGAEPESDNSLALEDTISLQSAMGLDGDTATFVKIVLMLADVAAEHLDPSKSYLEQEVPTEYTTEISERFPNFENYFVYGWPAYAFAKIYLDQLKEREERRKQQELQMEKIKSIVHSVCELLQPSV